MATKSRFIVFFLICFVFACTDENDTPVPEEAIENPDDGDGSDDGDSNDGGDASFTPVYNVPDSTIQEIVSSFLQEAFYRSVEIDSTNLIIRYDSTLTIGDCTLFSGVPAEGEQIQNEIVINPLIQKWTNNQEREAFWFHLLGHVWLAREDDESLLPNNHDPKSIMFPGFLSFFGPCVYAIEGSSNCNDMFKRDYYIDELFLPNTPPPNWGN